MKTVASPLLRCLNLSTAFYSRKIPFCCAKILWQRMQTCTDFPVNLHLCSHQPNPVSEENQAVYNRSQRGETGELCDEQRARTLSSPARDVRRKVAQTGCSSNYHLLLSKLLPAPVNLLPTRSIAWDKGRRRDGGNKSSAEKPGAAAAAKLPEKKIPKHLGLKSLLF